MENPALRLHLSDMRVTGLLALQYWAGPAAIRRHRRGSIRVLDAPRADPPGIISRWTFAPPINGFDPQNVCNGLARPVAEVNAWVADPEDEAPTLDVRWDIPQSISRVTLMFDSDFDHAMETVTRGHPEDVMPFAVKRYRLRNGAGRVLADVSDNHQTVNRFDFDEPIETDHLQVEIVESQGNAPAAVFALHCYE